MAGSLFGIAKLVAHCLVIETARDGIVLVDTGFGTRDVEGKTGIPRLFKAVAGPRLAHDQTAIAQLATLGYRPEDVRHIVITHLDLDHAGGLADFPAAKVHLHAREHAAAVAARTTRKERERYLAAQWSHGPHWEVYRESGDTWRGLPAIAKLRGLDADIGLLPMHGHTRGHSAVIAREAERWLVHAGDAYFHHGSVDDTFVPFGLRMFERATQMDSAQRRASVAALRALRSHYDDVAMFCAHDPREYEAMRAGTVTRAA